MGSGTKLTRIFQGLAPHYKLKIQFQFWKVDSWDDEEAYLYVDRKLGWKQAFSFSEGVHICGGG